MRTFSTWITALAGGVLITTAAAAAADHGAGLSTSSDRAPWSDLQGRVAFGATPPVWRDGAGGRGGGGLNVRRAGGVDSVSIMGDYYFAHPFAIAGGLRATSGLIMGPRSQGSSVAQPDLTAGGRFSVDSRAFAQPALFRRRGDALGSDTTAALPYIGLGYTARAARGAVSVSADLGMVGPTFGGDSPGRPFAASLRSLDEPGRDSRLLPVLQLGVLYSF